MRILFFGDVMGRSGRDGLAQHLPGLKTRLKPDVTIVNAENAAAGFGLNDKIAQEFYAQGVDCLTSGNHIWGQKELVGTIDRDPRLLRPLNFPEGTPGRGLYLHALPDGRKILILNVLARVFMEPVLDEPFAVTEKAIAQYRLGQSVQAIFIDFHGEATSEKIAFGRAVDGLATLVVGTHTHVQTADERILPGGTAYLTDAGFCGSHESVIGRDIASVLQKYRTLMPNKFYIAREGLQADGVFVEADPACGRALRIERIQEKVTLE
jgi:hypothetical protein